MRYEDASGAFQASGPIANDDADTLAAGSRGPATGNLITGEGTQYGEAGADSAAGAQIASIAGQGGEDSSFSGGKLSVAGAYGQLTVDAEGNYSYLANAGAPENVRDRFTYTLADSEGNTDTAALIVEIGKTPAVVRADAQQIVPGPDGVITLPPGVELSDIMVVGRNLVVNMPDGTQLIIVDGAVFVPQLVLGGVEVPATNVATLLIGQEPQPAAGETPPSSGGNFALPPPPLDPGVPLGDLLPPTEYDYTPPEPQETFVPVDNEPEIFVQPDGQPATVAAVDEVDEAGLPTRNGGEPEGSGEGADGNPSNDSDPSEATGGVIVYNSPDGVDSITINGVVVTTVGQEIAGEFGTLTITSIAPGQIGYTYTLLDNTSGDATHDDFLVVLTDSDGDQASATLTVNIIDDTPAAVNDTDSIAAGEFGPATGNVLTDADPGDAGDSDDGADTVGADDAELTNVTGFGATTPGEGEWVVQGQYGVLTINADGSYSYVRDPGTPGGVTDVFTYTLTDGDGDTDTATLTIDIGDAVPETGENPGVLLDDDALANGNPGGVGDDVDAANVTGTLAGSGGDGALSFDLLLTGAPAGFTYVDGPNGSVLVQQNGVTVLTITIDAATGEYSVTQNAPIDHPAGSNENNVNFTINYRVSDADGDTADGSLSINVDDDTPVVEAELDRAGAVTVDESGPTGASTIVINGVAKGDDGDVAGSGPIGRAVGSTAVVDATALFGADGPSGSGLTYSLQLGGSDTPLTLTDGSAIELQLIDGVVVGVVTEGPHAGEAAFAISINPSTGVATVELYLSIDHPQNPDPNDALALGPDTVSVVVTATDGDGDTAGSDPVDISGLFEFRDDGPSVDPELDADAKVTVDESLPSNAPAIDTGAIVKGDDPDLAGGVAIGQANSGVAIVDANALFGADGPAAADSITYALSITNPDAGVTLTDGTPIVLTMVGGVIVGVVNGGAFDGQAAFAIAIDPSSGVVTVEQYLSLDHPVNPDPNDPLGLGENSVAVTVTATDGDGDPVTSDAVDISGQITFLDDGPSVDPELNADAMVTVDESLPSDDPGIDTGAIVKGNDPDLAGGVAIGQATSGVAIVDANAVFGADGPAAGGGIGYALSITNVNSGVTLTDGTPIVLTMVGGVIVGVVDGGAFDGQAAFAIAIDPSSGVVTVEQYLSLDHPVNPDPNDPLGLGDNTIAVTVTATDGDGDPVTSDAIDISNQITFLDDGPSADPVLEQNATVTVDESLPSAAAAIDTLGIVKGDDPDLAGGLAIGSGNSGAAVIDVNAFFGADGPAAGGGVSYELSILNAASGLTLTDGSAIELQLLANGVVVGVVDGGSFDGQAAFAIAIDPVTGVVTVEQYLSLDHPDDTDPNDPLGLGEDTLGVTATITDGDGDSITTDAIDISDQITFLDDGPTAAVNPQAQLDTLVLDETTPPGTETDGDSNPAGLVSTTANFADNFSAVVNFGADGPGSVSYSFVLDGEDVGSGLYAVDPSDTETVIDGYGQGSEILLNASPDGLTITGSANGTDYFTITIDPVTGVVTFTQLDNIWHANTGSDDDTSTLMADIGALLVRQTVVDGDGDSATADLDISQGVFQIEDDGPVATDDVDEILAGGETAEGNVLTGAGTNAGVANADDVGADQPGRISQISGVGGTDSEFEGGVLEVDGQYGTLVIDADGNYTYTRFDGGAGDAQDVFTYTLIDADGDTDTATLTINIGDAAPDLPDPAIVRLDDDALANGNPGGVGDDVDQAGLPGQLAGTGGDGDLDYNFTALDTLPAGFSANHVDASTVQILQGATVVLTITLNNETGAFNVVQNNPINHLAGDNENNYDFSIGVEVEDADGDKEPATITINVDDDTPVLQNVTAGSSVDVDETDAGSPAGFPISDTSAGAVINATMLFGADGAAAANSIVYGLTIVGGSPQDSGILTAIGNHPITLVQIDADTIEGQYQDGGTQVAFTVQMNPDGTVTLTQNVPLEHDVDGGPGAAHNDTLDLSGLVNATITITDADGDSASGSAPIGDNIVFFDDGPDAAVNGQAPLDVITLDETRPEGSDTPGGSAPTGDASATANFADNFAGPADHGGDGPGTVSYALQLSAPGIGSGLFALDSSDTTTGDGDGYGQGAQITLSQVGNTITGSANGTDYFTISIDPVTGVVTFTQINPIWHPTAPSNFDEAATLTTATAAGIQVIQTVTDSDGDTDSASINVGQGVFVIQDDGPQAIQPDAAVLENEAGASVTADLDDDGEVLTDFGEDGEGLVQFANVSDGDDSGFTSNGDPITYWVSDDGQTLEARTNSTDGTDGELVFTVQINQASGDYTVTMTGSVDNGAGVSFNDLTSTAAGNVEYRGVGANDPDTTVDLLLSASKNVDGDAAYEDATVNTDSDSIGSANQSMDAQEAVRIDFVSNLQSPAGTPSGFSYDGHVDTNSYLQTIPQVQGNQAQTVDFTVYALNTTATDQDELDRDPSDGISDSTVVEITEVTVIGYVVSANPALDEQTPVTIDISALADGATVDVAYGISVTKNADGTVTFHGVQEGDQYGISTGSNDFNAVLVDAHDSFDLGVFSIGQVDTGDPVNLSFDLQIVDADGDTIVMPDAIDVTLQPAVDGFAATSFSLQDEQLQKTAANSNTLTMAAAVAAAGMAEPVAAQPSTDSDSLAASDASATSYSSQVVEKLVVDSDEGSGVSDAGSSELSGADAGPGNSSGHARGSEMSEGHQLDAGSSHPAASEAPASQPAEDQGSAASADAQVASAPTVAMASAEQLQAAGLEAQPSGTGSVEQVLADALGHGAAPTVDDLLAGLPGGIGGLPQLAQLASHDAGSVPGWDMASHAVAGGGFDMMFKVDVATHHQDAIQPAVNG